MTTSLNVERRTGPSAATLAVGVALLALVARLLYIQFYAAPIPYWDQWDGEAAFLLKPWIDGTLQWADLIRTHNEHRILPTRLVTLGSYLVTGQWNNLYEARVSALVYCFIPALLVWHALRDERRSRFDGLLVLVALAAAVLPFAWENILVGFQSQFYFLILSSLLAVSLAARQHENIIAIAGAVGLSIFAALTMASGMLTPVAVGATYVLACICLPGRRWPALGGVVVLAGIAVAAYVAIPVIPEHRTLQAQGALELVDALSHVLGWPVSSLHLAVVALWLPSVLMISRMLLRRQATRSELVMAGLCIWSALQGAAIAYGRGHGMETPTSRYTELFIPGLFGNAWFAVQLVRTMARPPAVRVGAVLVAGLFAVTFTAGMLHRIPADMAMVRERAEFAQIQQRNVLRYLTSNDPSALQVEYQHIPYPNAERLKALLDDPALRGALFVEVVPAVGKEPAPAH
ncbi:hypothetical protein C1924_02725 [Stenotrophomonas sp. ESTM1D_MKCIP4_1]|uniref:hypothetical protein n=1 Tax=Stenotrophomonas sp. ESTM1D_MKCIP4_1 TaxID=2072414 RepID=UPI000D53E2DC|nr:hypothetical protein [Stenotrophomonas sp. ESTM1D_MKCIP4_1]AWH52177.1 hypothetical protein C1924_02725 [Stenotrophomonas sp. ESTM1D_MKCIP4_1]